MKSKAIAFPYVGWMALFVVAPLVIITVYAFTSDAGGFTLANFQDMAQYTAAFGRSFLLAAIATVICVLIGYPLAYFLARETSWVHRMATMLIMLPMWMNFLLRTYSWKFLLERNGLINTLFGLFGVGPFQMIDTQGAIVLGMVYNFLPYMVLPIFSVIEKIDPKVIEAAQDLGANDRTPVPAGGPQRHHHGVHPIGVHLRHLPAAGRQQDPPAGQPHRHAVFGQRL